MSDQSDPRIRALQEEVRWLRAMLEHTPDFIARVKVDGTVLYANRAAPDFVSGQSGHDSIERWVPAEYQPRLYRALRDAGQSGETQEYAALGPIRGDKLGHFLTRVSPLVEDGKVTSLLLIGTNVTALAEHRTLLQVALNAGGLGIWTYELSSGGGSADETTRRIFGIVEPDSALHITSMLQERIHPDDRDLVAAGLTQAVHSGGAYGPLEHRILRPDGELRWVAASGVAIRDHQGEVRRVVGSVMDITHRRALEARLLETQKLESIGRLAGGVAHDFNNMLTAILGNLELAHSSASLDEARPLLAEIRLTAERSAALTAQLLAFARRQVVELRVFAPHALLGKLESLLRRLLGEQIQLVTQLESRGHVRMDASQLEQVVLNLITNARDSMPEGGSVTLVTRDVSLEAVNPTLHAELAPGRYVQLVVSDDGAGISPQALPQIFDPFFTTRAGGTGLGLATCYGIVKQSGGQITVHSQLGQGATFYVYLPRVDDAEVVDAARATLPMGAVRSERVLLVEDEAVVRSVVERTLQRAHYRVMTATSGEEALQSTESEAPFDLLITDVMMPGMTGWELGKSLQQRWPGLRVLYMSGYTEGAASDGVAREPFLQKPFMPAELLAIVRKLLDE